MLHKHRKITSALTLVREKTTENHGTPTEKCSICANATCLGALRSGHSKFLLVTGDCCKRMMTSTALLCKTLRNEPVQLGFGLCVLIGFVVPGNFRFKVFQQFFVPESPASSFKTIPDRTVVF